MNSVRFLVIEVGGFGKKRIDAIMRNKKAELVYVVDADECIAERFARYTGGEAVSFEQLISRKGFDVAIIAVPNRFYEEITCKVLQIGKVVWTEKPMSISIDSALRMVMKSIEVGKFLKIDSNVRYFCFVA
jgi:predicted dehydrogenase